MNAQLLNPFARDTPERIEGTLANASAQCLEYNAGRGLFAGCYLAVGRTDGLIVIWDVETRSILRWFVGHAKPVTSVSWSPLSRYVASSSHDWNVNIWDLGCGPARCVRTLRFSSPVARVCFSPRTSRSLLVILESREAYLVLFPTSDDTAAPSTPRRVRLDASDPISTACFTPDGKWVVAGTVKGALVTWDARGELAWDVHGRHLAANLNDRTVRTLDVAMRDAPPRFVARHKFQDMVSRTPWSGVGFSHDGEYVMGGAAQDAAHHIYLWDRDAGVLVKILEGPREPLILAAWHPSKPQLASIASSGDVHLWSTTTTENWSAYAPGFEELEKNVEYEERENEFDMDDLDQLDRQRQDDEAGTINLFDNGPVPVSSLPPVRAVVDLRRTHSTLAPVLAAEPQPDAYVDDDDQVGFLIPPLLEWLVDDAREASATP